VRVTMVIKTKFEFIHHGWTFETTTSIRASHVFGQNSRPTGV